VLPIPDPTLELPGGTWSAGDSRIVSGGGDPNDPSRVGLYSRRSSDGGGLIRLTDAGTRADLPIQSSPDGSKLLFFRPDAKNETSDSAPQDLFVVGADGSGLTRLTPKGTTTAVVGSYDSVSWSPDGTQVAAAAANGPFFDTTIRSVYIASADGSSFKRVGPLGNIWDAVWSPDGRWIAFSMASKATGGQFELYLMHPDGSGARQLTSGTDGLFSLHRHGPPTAASSCSSEGPATWTSPTSGRSTSTARTYTRSRTSRPGTGRVRLSRGCHKAARDTCAPGTTVRVCDLIMNHAGVGGSRAW